MTDDEMVYKEYVRKTSSKVSIIYRMFSHAFRKMALLQMIQFPLHFMWSLTRRATGELSEGLKEGIIYTVIYLQCKLVTRMFHKLGA